ncbi:hypothetical protein LJB96_04175 [Methanobrevibacter sp. OttesenSCG-928-K11]|nr:hypothetical protein [Methanobrevibacter sp. OttesenSCG-928-K11]
MAKDKKTNSTKETDDKVDSLSKSINTAIFKSNISIDNKLENIDKGFDFILNDELEFINQKERLISQNLNSLDHENFKKRLKKL